MAVNIKNVAVGGGTGFIGKALGALLESKGYGVTVISRNTGIHRLTWRKLMKNGLPDGTMAVVNVAGQNILDATRRWTEEFRSRVYRSRVMTTLALKQAIMDATKKPKVFVTISGVGYYPPSKVEEYTENSKCKRCDFLSNLVHDWEEAAILPRYMKVRNVVVRSGVVLGRDGGVIRQLYFPFLLGVGGPFGTGDQFMPWIHIDDLANLLLFAIENDGVEGILNGVAPEITTNKKFTETFAQAMGRRTYITIPEFALNFAFNEERAKIMTEGQKVIPARTLSYGFTYKYPTIQAACEEVLSSSSK